MKILNVICFIGNWWGDWLVGIFFLLYWLAYFALGTGILYLIVLGIKILRRKLANKDTSASFPIQHLVDGSGAQNDDLRQFPVKISDKTVFIPMEKITYFQAEDNYVNLYDGDSNKFLIDYTLTDLEKKLPPFFMRVHRSYIINKHLIKEIRRHSGSKFTLVLKDKSNHELVTSQSYALEVKKLMEL